MLPEDTDIQLKGSGECKMQALLSTQPFSSGKMVAIRGNSTTLRSIKRMEASTWEERGRFKLKAGEEWARGHLELGKGLVDRTQIPPRGKPRWGPPRGMLG